MKADDIRRRTMNAYPVKRSISVRVSDRDGYGYMNTLRIGHFYEDARAAFYREAFGGVARPPLAPAA